MHASNVNSPAIILFDEKCNLCANVVRFVLPRDTRGYFRFASLQGSAATRECAALGFILESGTTPTTLIVLEHGRVLKASDAALAIARQLSFPWCIAVVFRVVPRALRDVCYRFVAAHRYRWFGASEHCLLPGDSMRNRFLE